MSSCRATNAKAFARWKAVTPQGIGLSDSFVEAIDTVSSRIGYTPLDVYMATRREL